MLCQKCHQNEATVHFRQNINGEISEIHLCQQCAAELGYDSVFSQLEHEIEHEFSPFGAFNMGFQQFLGNLFSQEMPSLKVPAARKCRYCGMKLDDFAKTAMVGCAHCYQEFLRDMMPYIQRIHGRTRHVGKIPTTAGKQLKLQRELTQLRKQLNDAVNAQEYEKAAELRDKIRELEKKVQDK